MKVEKFWFSDLNSGQINKIKSGRDIVVVVDLWAATTNIGLMLSKKPKRLIIVNEKSFPNTKAKFPKSVLIGESNDLAPSEFLVGNNRPYFINKKLEIKKNILYLSDNGSRVLEALVGNRNKVFTFSMSGLKALAKVVREIDPRKVLIVASGKVTKKPPDNIREEDFLGAEMLEKEILGESYDVSSYKNRIKKVILDRSYEHVGDSEIEMWPFVFAKKTDIVPSAIINSVGLVEVVEYGSSRGS